MLISLFKCKCSFKTKHYNRWNFSHLNIINLKLHTNKHPYIICNLECIFILYYIIIINLLYQIQINFQYLLFSIHHCFKPSAFDCQSFIMIPYAACIIYISERRAWVSMFLNIVKVLVQWIDYQDHLKCNYFVYDCSHRAVHTIHTNP